MPRLRHEFSRRSNSLAMIFDLHMQVRRPCGQGRCRESNACIPRRLTEPSLSALLDRARRLRRMQVCETRFQLSSKTSASLREASPWHRQGLPSSTRSAQAEKLFLLFAWPYTHSLGPPTYYQAIIGLHLSAIGQWQIYCLLRRGAESLVRRLGKRSPCVCQIVAGGHPSLARNRHAPTSAIWPLKREKRK